MRARKAMTGERAPLAFLTLIRRNRRRYGGYTVHFGMAVLFIGVAASSAFQHVHTVELKKGQSVEIGRGYTARYDGPTSRIDVDADGVERLVFGAKLTVSKEDKKVAVLKPERGYYPIEGAPFAGAVGRYFDGESTSEIAMKAGLGLDIWSAVTPDLDPTLKIVKEGDAVFKQASGKLGAQDYSTAPRHDDPVADRQLRQERSAGDVPADRLADGDLDLARRAARLPRWPDLHLADGRPRAPSRDGRLRRSGRA